MSGVCALYAGAVDGRPRSRSLLIRARGASLPTRALALSPSYSLSSAHVLATFMRLCSLVPHLCVYLPPYSLPCSYLVLPTQRDAFLFPSVGGLESGLGQGCRQRGGDDAHATLLDKRHDTHAPSCVLSDTFSPHAALRCALTCAWQMYSLLRTYARWYKMVYHLVQ